jgi:hypothetical protein
MKLGRLPHDPARVASAPSLAAHRFAAAAPPRAVVDRSGIPFSPGLYQNDSLPDCTAAGLANAASAVAWAEQGFQPVIQPALVVDFYAACINRPSATDAELMATDGAVMLDVLTRQATLGFDVGQQVPLVGLFGTLPLANIPHAIDRLSHAYLGVTLRERDMDMAALWDVQDGRDDGAVVGGHCLVAWDYTGLQDGDTVRLVTWGQFQPATWPWLRARVDEAYALTWRQNSGVDADTLRAELDEFTG